MVLSPAADVREAEEGWLAGRVGLRLVEAPGPGWRGVMAEDGAVRAVSADRSGAVSLDRSGLAVSSDSLSRRSGEIALVCAGRPVVGEVERARAAGLRVLWLATGRELATPGALDEWLQVGLEGLHLWAHAAASQAHDFHAGVAGRFAAIAAAMAKARRAGVAVAVSSLLTRSSAPVLAGLPAWLQGLGAAAWRVAAIDTGAPLLRGAGVGPHDGLVPSLAVALPHALQAMSRAGRLGLPAFLSGAPACLLGPFAGAALRERGRSFAPGCAGCAARAGCCGVAADYLERFGVEELGAANLRAASPVPGPRWMFVGTGLIEQVETDMSVETGPKRQVRLPVMTGTGDDG